MNLLEELKNINPRNPGGWPWLVKLAVLVAIFVAVVFGGAVLDWQGQWEALGNAQQEEEKLKEAFLVKKKEAINLDIIKKQLTETQQSFGALLKQLPNKSEMDALLTDINQAGLGRGLQFDLFRPGAEVVNGVFAEQPIVIRVTGNYDDLGKFASDISQLPRIVTLNDIFITRSNVAAAPGSQNVPLIMETLAKTFRYLDETELAAQKMAAKSAKAKK
ncbi:MAG: type 4a pilus biogenesis protein PilO [Nitrosomonadales bacterium]|nr:type 4a pilus biogenesis protein PilO [Nitrosomonadales bacterium]